MSTRNWEGIRVLHQFVSRAAGIAGALGLLVALAVPGAHAQSGNAEWDKTVAAAKKEGQLLVNLSPNRSSRAFVTKAWKMDFPEITLNATSIRGGQFIGRILAERKAGKFLWDASFAGGSSGYRLAKQGVLDPLLPELILPENKNAEAWGGWDSAFFDRSKKYVLATQKFMNGIWYNANKVPTAKVKKLGMKILLDPAYKGKILWHDPLNRGSGQAFAVLVHRGLGAEGLTKLIKGGQVVFIAGQNDVADRMAREVGWISIGPILTEALQKHFKAGQKRDFRLVGQTPDVAFTSTGGSAVYVINKRPHPNATKVFVNWLLSKRIQTELSKAMRFDSRRTDVPPAAEVGRRPVKGVNYPEIQREDMFRELKMA